MATTQSTDEFGNPKVRESGEHRNPNVAHQTDEFGNPIYSTGGTTGFEGTGKPYDTGLNTGMTGHRETRLHRSGSSSSSSSEDDGQGGRRKKGLKQKIKEKLPGTHNDQTHPATTPGVHHSSATGYGEVHEKTGIMDKIKEKLPGTHKDQTHPATAPGVHHSSATGYGEVHEKKGIMDKVKDKLPGHHDHH